MKEPFSIEEYIRIKKEFTIEIIQKQLQNMHNWADLKKRKSANLTLRNFIDRAQNSIIQKTETGLSKPNYGNN